MEKEKAAHMRKIFFLLMVSFALSLTACAVSSATPGNVPSSSAPAAESSVADEPQNGLEGKGDMQDVKRIPDELEQIPDEYYTPASQQGTLERLTYTTWESMSYAAHEQQLTKTAYVYLPYGYTEGQNYNVYYLMHGGWSNETTYLGTPEAPSSFVNVINHAIQNGRMKPMIIVCPTYNNISPSDSGDYSLAIRLTDNYHNELVNDLMPAVEGKYSTYAEKVTPEGLQASRNHRGFGGFSMGSVATWRTFQYCLDYFRYFSPSSGNLTSDGQFMSDIVTDAGYDADDFFIYAMSGTEDFAYSGFNAQIAAMKGLSNGVFVEANQEQEGNLAYRVVEGNSHDHHAATQYVYNMLCWLW